MDSVVKAYVDAGAVGIVGATLVGWLPAIAALLTILWTAIRIFETATVQRLLGRMPAKGAPFAVPDDE